MTAETKPNVRVTNSEWTQVSATNCMITVLSGQSGFAFAPTKPPDSPQAGSMGHIFNEGDGLNNPNGGTLWGRATDTTKSAHIGLTEY